jgi:hypothetical protein
MKNRITIISIGLNMILIGAILLVLRKPAENSITQPAIRVSRVAVTQINETVTQTNFLPQQSPTPFDWSQIESEDFLIYAENLRGVGCPEETVRDILTAEINDLFVRRRQDLFRPFQSQFWDLMAQGDLNDLLPKEAQEKVDALDDEKRALLKKVFRAAPLEEKNLSTTEYESLLADKLSPEKIQRLRETNEKFNKLREEIQASHLPDAEKQKKIAALNEQSVAAQNSVLSPEELEEFNLRKSSFAQQLQSLYGFQASEQELRAMARLTLNERPFPTDTKSPQYETKLAEHRAEREKIDKQLTALLGENRFAEYERSKDGYFQNLSRLAHRYELSPQTISEVYELARSIHEQVRTFKNSNLAGEEQEDALETIRQQTQQAMVGKLGARAAETYRRNFNNWDEIPDP